MMKEKKLRLGSALVIRHEEKILLGKRGKEPNYGRWILPGGKIELGEDHVVAGQREAMEELGIEVEIQELAGKGVYYLTDEKAHRVIIYSFAKPLSLDLNPSSDLLDAKFFSLEELQEIDLTEIVVEVLQDCKLIN